MLELEQSTVGALCRVLSRLPCATPIVYQQDTELFIDELGGTVPLYTPIQTVHINIVDGKPGFVALEGVSL